MDFGSFEVVGIRSVFVNQEVPLSFHVVATYTAQEGRGDELESHLKAMLGPSQAEPGCISYRVIRSDEDPDQFVIVEEYESSEAFEEHRNSPHFEQHARRGAMTLLASRIVVTGHEVTV